MGKIYYVRHGKTEYNTKKLWSGTTNTQLTNEGKKQAKDTGEQLKKIKFDIAFVSPLQRAIDTFGFINKPHRLIPIIDKRIIERPLGKMEGTTNVEEDSLVKRTKLHNYKLNSDFGLKIEKIQVTDKRVKNFINEITKKHKNKNILIVAHGGIGRHFEAHFNGIPKNGVLPEESKNAEVRIYKF
ncbi:MAG: histidine phosphatase family protein [Mycoplasmataceae bacterium]|jgi:probable phosphoglycerate mutase|nr:histidine phosphatase family protein [Mycoplasmataceae bacterium]